MENLEEAKLALKILRSIFTSLEISDEKVAIFAGIIRNQSIKIGIDWKALLKQYKELSSEVYKDHQFKNNNMDFFSQTQKYIEFSRKLI